MARVFAAPWGGEGAFVLWLLLVSIWSHRLFFSCLLHTWRDVVDKGLDWSSCFWGNVMSCHISLCFICRQIRCVISFVWSLVDLRLIFRWIVFFPLCGLFAFIWFLQRRFRLVLMSLRVTYLSDMWGLTASLGSFLPRLSWLLRLGCWASPQVCSVQGFMISSLFLCFWLFSKVLQMTFWRSSQYLLPFIWLIFG